MLTTVLGRCRSEETERLLFEQLTSTVAETGIEEDMWYQILTALPRVAYEDYSYLADLVLLAEENAPVDLISSFGIAEVSINGSHSLLLSEEDQENVALGDELTTVPLDSTQSVFSCEGDDIEIDEVEDEWRDGQALVEISSQVVEDMLPGTDRIIERLIEFGRTEGPSELVELLEEWLDPMAARVVTFDFLDNLAEERGWELDYSLTGGWSSELGILLEECLDPVTTECLIFNLLADIEENGNIVEIGYQILAKSPGLADDNFFYPAKPVSLEVYSPVDLTSLPELAKVLVNRSDTEDEDVEFWSCIV